MGVARVPQRQVAYVLDQCGAGWQARLPLAYQLRSAAHAVGTLSIDGHWGKDNLRRPLKPFVVLHIPPNTKGLLQCATCPSPSAGEVSRRRYLCYPIVLRGRFAEHNRNQRGVQQVLWLPPSSRL